jgi:hypothetical protein
VRVGRVGAAALHTAALVALVTACTGGAGSGTVGSSARSNPSANASIVSASFPAIVLDPILEDASARTGVPKGSLEIVTAEERTWPDGSLGCPVPGMAYTQVVVDGYRIVVRAGARTLDYRGSGPGRFRLCEVAAPS